MAGDWIKMRVWLARDPRVIRMADYLAEQRSFMDWLTDPVRQSCKETAYEHVTRNVTVALCVTGLLVTWGTAREQGDREGDDLRLAHCDKYTFDAITDIECFGEAMESVGWLREEEDGCVVFPKFFKDNESPDEKHKRQNAERQARFREKSDAKSNAEVTPVSNVTVTHREEKRREEVNIITPDKPATKKGSQVSQEFTPNATTIQRAATLGVDWKAELPKFIDHHTNKGTIGKDWDAGFRTWLANSVKFGTAEPIQITKQVSAAICACCGSPASRKEMNSWYCSQHDRHSERVAA